MVSAIIVVMSILFVVGILELIWNILMLIRLPIVSRADCESCCTECDR